KYLGNSWWLSKSHRSNPSIFTEKHLHARQAEQLRKARQVENRKTVKEHYQLLCDKFDIKNKKEDPLLQIVKSKFCGLKFEKRQAIINNVDNFKRYCAYYSEEFNLPRYYSQEWYEIDFPKKYPEIFSKSNSGNLNSMIFVSQKNFTFRL